MCNRIINLPSPRNPKGYTGILSQCCTPRRRFYKSATMNIKHGHTVNHRSSPTYHSWQNMIDRCENVNSSSYYLYGERGIIICDAWHNFASFLRDMGVKPVGLSLGRIDNDGPYCKSNCHWETPEQQANNCRSNILLTYNNETRTASQWSRILNIKSDTILRRIKKGLTTDNALQRFSFKTHKPLSSNKRLLDSSNNT